MLSINHSNNNNLLANKENIQSPTHPHLQEIEPERAFKRLRRTPFLEALESQQQLFNLSQFTEDLIRFSQQKNTLKGRLKLLKNLKEFKDAHYEMKLAYASSFLHVALSETQEETTFKVCNQFNVPLFQFSYMSDNRWQENLIQGEENLAEDVQSFLQTLRSFYDLSEQVKILDLTDWLPAVPESASFAERVILLKNAMTFVRNPAVVEGPTEWWQAWLEINSEHDKNSPPLSLRMILTESPYDSNTFAATPENLEQTYLFIKFFEERDEKCTSPVYVLRVGLNGQQAELLHLQAVFKQLSGTFMRDHLHLPLEGFLKTDSIILHDAAKVQHPSSRELELRILRGSSWYETIGYRALDCRDKLLPDGTIITQSSSYYAAAVVKMASLSLDHFHDVILKGCYAERFQLRRLRSTYLSSADSSFLTLVNRISVASRQKSSKAQQQASRDLLYVYDHFLTVGKLPMQPQKEQKLYYLALDIIGETRIFHKTRGEQASQPAFDLLLEKALQDHSAFTWKTLLPYIES